MWGWVEWVAGSIVRKRLPCTEAISRSVTCSAFSLVVIDILSFSGRSSDSNTAVLGRVVSLAIRLLCEVCHGRGLVVAPRYRLKAA
ncbi:hypothetical protein Poly51_16790 [Rubripirellula tenax]|uniref:Uncharacterized protein n=1 Tax=Rubripirellula tenax TaxID=2528015 RepID=A0A5C6FGV8_9BACT|nr:hypothetical protein Poly51_16790 [Rubripirellula tenax]